MEATNRVTSAVCNLRLPCRGGLLCQRLLDAKAAATLVGGHPCLLVYAISSTYATVFCSSKRFTNLKRSLIHCFLPLCLSLLGIFHKSPNDLVQVISLMTGGWRLEALDKLGSHLETFPFIRLMPACISVVTGERIHHLEGLWSFGSSEP